MKEGPRKRREFSRIGACTIVQRGHKDSDHIGHATGGLEECQQLPCREEEEPRGPLSEMGLEKEEECGQKSG